MGTVNYTDYDTQGNVVRQGSVTTPPEFDNLQALQDAARQALATNRTYVALAAPTAAQTTAEVKALARQHNGIIRLLLGILDGTD